MSKIPFFTTLQPAVNVTPVSSPATNGSTATDVAGKAKAVPDAVEEYEKLLNVRFSDPLTVVVFPFDVATIAAGVLMTVVVSPGSKTVGREIEPARASRAPKPETRSPAAIVRKSERIFISIS
jgi:hypothetical protein